MDSHLNQFPVVKHTFCSVAAPLYPTKDDVMGIDSELYIDSQFRK